MMNELKLKLADRKIPAIGEQKVSSDITPAPTTKPPIKPLISNNKRSQLLTAMINKHKNPKASVFDRGTSSLDTILSSGGRIMVGPISSSSIYHSSEEKCPELKSYKKQNNKSSKNIFSDIESVCTQTTTSSLTSYNTHKHKKKKKKRKNRNIMRVGNHITDRNRNRNRIKSNDEKISILNTQQLPTKSPPILSKENLLNHNQRIETKNPIIHQTIPIPSKLPLPTTNYNHYQYNLHSNLSIPHQLLFVHIFAFLSAIDFTINLPTIYQTCMEINSNDPLFFIWLFFIYLIFQSLSALLFSYFLNYSRIKWILILQSFMLGFGNILYIHGIAKENSLFLLCVGRAFCGISGSILILGYAHSILCSTIINREQIIVIFRFLSALGMIIGPFIGLLSSERKYQAFDTFSVTENNSGSFIICIATFIYLLLFVSYLILNHFYLQQNVEIEENEANYNVYEYHRILNLLTLKNKRFSHSLVCSPHSLLLLFLYTSSLFVFWSFSAMVFPIASNEVNIELPFSTVVIYVVISVVIFLYICSFIAHHLILKRFQISLEKRVIIAIQCQAIGCMFLTTLGVYSHSRNVSRIQLVFAAIFMTVGFGIATIHLPAIYCLIASSKVRNIGYRTCWFFVISSVVRMFAPVYGYFMIEIFDGSVDFLAHFNTIYLLIISLIAFVIVMKDDVTNVFYQRKNEFVAESVNEMENESRRRYTGDFYAGGRFPKYKSLDQKSMHVPVPSHSQVSSNIHPVANIEMVEVKKVHHSFLVPKTMSKELDEELAKIQKKAHRNIFTKDVVDQCSEIGTVYEISDILDDDESVSQIELGINRRYKNELHSKSLPVEQRRKKKKILTFIHNIRESGKRINNRKERINSKSSIESVDDILNLQL